MGPVQKTSPPQISAATVTAEPLNQIEAAVRDASALLRA